LPVELYRPIARCIRSKRALCAFARVSRATQPEAERLIYRWLTAKTAIEIVVLLKRIVSLKRIGPYVFSLDIKHSHRFSLHERPMIPTSALFQLLSSALTLLAGLRHLVIDFSDVYQGSSISCSFIFNRAPFRLFSFASSLSVDAGFVRFLLHQPDIVYISFLSFPWYPSTIPPHALPKLRAVHSVIDHFTWSFLPDRLLTHLSMHHLRASTPAGSLSSLRVLKIRSIPEIAPDLEIIYGLDDDIVSTNDKCENYRLITPVGRYRRTGRDTIKPEETEGGRNLRQNTASTRKGEDCG
jgi:hypothetical protein